MIEGGDLYQNPQDSKAPYSEPLHIEVQDQEPLHAQEVIEPTVYELPSYITPQRQWPPAVETSNETYLCIASQTEMGSISEKIISGKKYCLDVISEGAAGSSYGTYVIKTIGINGMTSTDFTLGYVNCQNYDEPEKTECSNSRNSFNIDELISSVL